MPSSQNTEHPTYDLDHWVAAFGRAEPDLRAAVAAQWLGSFIGDIARNGPHISGSVMTPLIQHLVPVREMVAAIPADHRERRLSLSGVSTARLEATLHFLRYIDIDAPLSAPGQIPSTSLVNTARDMWLQPALADRTSALVRLVSEPALTAQIIATSDRLIRLAAWQVAIENDMREDLVVAAAKITLATYLDLYSTRGGTPMCNAISMVLACNESDDPTLSDDLPLSLAKEIVIAHPEVSLLVLKRVNEDDRFRSRRLHSSGPNSIGMFASLATWLPGSRDVIALACDMGLSYTATLEQLVSAATHPASELPEGIAP